MGIKYPVNENSFLEWGHEMAYVIGFIFADGGLEDTTPRGKYLRVTSNDREAIEHVKDFMQAKHPIVNLSRDSTIKNNCYFIRIGNQKIYKTLLSYGLQPRKSLTIEMPKIPRKFLPDFVRGVFDGDGCVYIERKKNKNGETSIKRLSVIFTSGSKRFLEQLSSTLYSAGCVKLATVYRSNRSYQLRYSTAESILLFKFFYNHYPNTLYLSRKFAIFKEYFHSKPNKIDRKIHTIVA